MNESNPIVEWWIALAGDERDLSDAIHFIGNQIFQIENDDDGCCYLKSESLNSLNDGWAVMACGEELVAQANGALTLLLSDFRRIEAAKPVPIHANGSRGVVILVPSASFSMRFGRPTIVIAGQTPKNDTIEINQWLQQCNSDSDIADVLHFISRGPRWFDLYKTFEVIRSDLGGEKKTIDKLSKDQPEKTILRNELKLFRRTAQMYRHSRMPGEPPSDPMSLQNANELIRRLAARYLRYKADNPDRATLSTDSPELD